MQKVKITQAMRAIRPFMSSPLKKPRAAVKLLRASAPNGEDTTLKPHSRGEVRQQYPSQGKGDLKGRNAS
jgi:hypothetical protein